MCGGRNHGAGENQATENTRELTEDWIEKMKEKANLEDLVMKIADNTQQLLLLGM
jgi:hypothetical protein